MKRILNKICISLVIITVLFSASSGCSKESSNINTEQNAATYVKNEDFQNFLDPASAFAKAENGYYFLHEMKLYYFDVETKEAYIVCNKPNCEHNNSDCTAFFSIFRYFPFQLSYYNHSLYVLGWEEDGSNLRHNYIYEISLDTYKRKKAAYLFDGTDTSSVSFILHRGYIYYLKGSTDELKETTSYLYRKKLGDTSQKETSEIVYEHSGIGAAIIDIRASGNNIVILNASFGDTAGNDYKTTYTLIDIHSLESKELVGNNAYSLFLNGNYAYYEKGEDVVNCINLMTQAESFFCDIDGPAYISADSKYVYFDNLQKMYIDETFTDRKILVYDTNGNYITEIVPKNPKDICYFGGDDIMIFKEIVPGEAAEVDSVKDYYVLDKSRLTASNKQFIDME